MVQQISEIQRGAEVERFYQENCDNRLCLDNHEENCCDGDEDESEAVQGQKSTKNTSDLLDKTEPIVSVEGDPDLESEQSDTSNSG